MGIRRNFTIMKKLTALVLILSLAANLFAGMTITDRVKLRQNGVVEFEGATNNNFETIITVIDPTADRTITLKDESGTIAFLTDTASVSGTANNYVLFATASTLGDAFQRQLGGNILWDDLSNDIVTWDFVTLPTGAIALSIGDVSGTVMVDNGGVSTELLLSTATSGEATASGLRVIGGNELKPASGTFRIEGLSELRSASEHEKVAFTSGGGSDRISFDVDNATRMDILADEFILFSGVAFRQESDSGASQVKINMDNFSSSGMKHQSWSIHEGTFAMFATQSETLTADDTVIVVVASEIVIDSNSATSTDRSLILSTTGAVAGQTVILRYDDAGGGDDAEIAAGTTNMKTTGGAAITFNADDQVVMFYFDGTDWQQATPLSTNS